MAEYTRPATWEDVEAVVRLLNEAGVEYALVGGYALAAHGYVRFSDDVDVLVEPSPENARKWIQALGRLPDQAAKELTGEEDIFLREGSYAVRINDEFTVDVLPAASRYTRRPRNRSDGGSTRRRHPRLPQHSECRSAKASPASAKSPPRGLRW